MRTSTTRIARSYLGVGMLLLAVTACSESSDADSAASSSPTATTTVATTAAPASTDASTTEPATTTTEPVTVVAVGTWSDVPDASFPAVKLPSGYTWLGEELSFDGDLVGTTLYDIGVSPVGETGLVTAYADGTFRGTLVGVGDGTLAWSEPETDVTLPSAPGSAPLVGVSGAFLGATGTFSWAYTDDSTGTYEVRLVWD